MTAPVRKPLNSGTVQRCYVSATAFAETCDTEAEFLAALAVADQFTRIDNILTEAKLADSRQTGTFKPRGLDFELTFVGGRVIGFSAKIAKSLGATGYDLLRTAYYANSVIAIAVSTGDITVTGVKSLCFNCQVTKWDEDQPDPGAATHDFAVAVTADSIVLPTEVTKAA